MSVCTNESFHLCYILLAIINRSLLAHETMRSNKINERYHFKASLIKITKGIKK